MEANLIDTFVDDDTLCFCGSNRAFADCHKKRAYKHPNEISIDHRKFLKWWTGCGISENGELCREPAIASHSLQRRGALRAIGENHHVLTFSGNKYGKLSPDEKGDYFRRVSTKTASTFFGLCSKHDNSVFSDIEGEIDTRYHTALGLAIRAALYEALEHTKNTLWLEYLSRFPTYDFHFSSVENNSELANMRFYSSYSWELLKRLQSVRERASPRRFSFASVEFEGVSPFCATGCFCIELDFAGNVLQDFSLTQRFNYAQLTVLQIESDRWAFFLSALEDQNRGVARSLLKSLLKQPKSLLADCALRAIVVHTENAFFKPSWVQSLNQEKQQRILDLFSCGADFRVGEKKEANTLSTPLLENLDFRVVRVNTNIRPTKKR